VTITITGFAVILAGLVLFFASQRRLVQAIIFFAPFSGTAIINFSAYGMSPDVFLFGIYMIWKLLSGEVFERLRVGRDHLHIAILLIAFTVVCIGSLLFNGGMAGIAPIQITQTAYLMFGLSLTVALSFEFTRDGRLEDGVRALRASAMFVSLWGILQVACYYTGIEYPAFLFNNSTSHFADMFDQRAGSFIRIASVAVEPSFLATTLMIFGAFGATLVTIDDAFRIRSWLLPTALTLSVVLASTSTTGYVGLATLLLLLAMRQPGKVAFLGLFCAVALAAVLVLVPEVRDIAYAFTLGKTSSGSYMDRTATVWKAFDLFAQRPWLGWGWGSDYSYSIVSIMLCNTGIIGTGIFALAFGGTLVALRAARSSVVVPGSAKLQSYALAAENALIVYLAQNAVSGFKYVVADFWCFWGLAIAIPSCLAASMSVRATYTTVGAGRGRLPALHGG
jgi:hypothetical protein